MTVEHKEESEQTVTETVIVLFAAILFMVFLVVMAGCSRGEYWQFDAKPGPVKAEPIVVADTRPVCGMDALGCYDPGSGLIYLRASLLSDMTLYQCVVSHEYHHAAGFRHPKFPESPLAVNCGDGTIHPGVAL